MDETLKSDFAQRLLSLELDEISSLEGMSSSYKAGNEESRERIVERVVELLFGEGDDES